MERSKCIDDLLSKMYESLTQNGINTKTFKCITYVEPPSQTGTPSIPAAPATDENPATPAIPAKAAIPAVSVMVSFQELLHHEYPWDKWNSLT